MTRLIYMNCGECGSFKTTTLIEEIIKGTKRGERYLIVQPSKELGLETHQKLLASGIQTSLINEDTVQGSVHEHANRMLCLSSSNSIIITHATFLNLSTRICNDWNLRLDEELPTYESLNRDITDSNDLIDWNQWFDFQDIGHETVRKMVARPQAQTMDSNLTAVAEYLKEANNPTKDVYCEFAEGTYARTGKDRIYINGFSMINKKRFHDFKSISVYGAMIDRSLLAKLLSGFGFEIQVTRHFEKHTRKVVIHHGNLPTMSFDAIKRNPEYLTNFKNHVRRNSVGKDVIWLVPKNEKKNCPVEPVSHLCHGLNVHSHKTHVAISAVTNRTQQFNSFLKHTFLMNSDDLYLHANGNLFYQTIMRSTLRRHDSEEVAHVFLPDKRSANFIANNFFENATLVEFDIGYEKTPKRKTTKKTKSDEEKRADSRFRTQKSRFLKEHPYYRGLTNSELFKTVEWVEKHFLG